MSRCVAHARRTLLLHYVHADFNRTHYDLDRAVELQQLLDAQLENGNITRSEYDVAISRRGQQKMPTWVPKDFVSDGTTAHGAISRGDPRFSA